MKPNAIFKQPTDTVKCSRRHFIKTSALAALGFNLIGCSRSARKPNLLFLWTDEQRADTMAVYGNSKIHAPNLNKLASESVVFEHAYITQPVCTPSRSTVMTGLWPHTNGCTENNIPLPANIPCFPEILNDPDYRTGYFGKWHLGDEVFAQHGFEEWISIEDIYWEYFSEGRDRNAKSSYAEYLLSLGYQPDRDRGDFTREFASRLPLEHCKPKFLEQKACDFLQRHRREPFLLYVNFLEPHPPFFGPLNDEHDPATIDLPLNFNDPLEEDEPLRYRLIRNKLYQNGYKGKELRSEEQWRRLAANYWGLVTQVDLSVGAILAQLEKLGLADNTIVVFTSDHGDMMGAHRLLNKTVMYQESVSVPWLMRIPQLNKRQHIVSNPVSHIDLVPTLLELMGKKTETYLQGKSLLPLLKKSKTVAEDVFIEWNPKLRGDETYPALPGVSAEEVKRAEDASIRTVITPDGWKLCWSDQDKCQLFDLNKDPLETTNLYYREGYQEVKSRLKHKIVTWQEQVKDKISLG
jgi:arylsulfatase A-like enzyme